MTPVISMSSLMEIRTKYALRRIDIVPYKVPVSYTHLTLPTKA